LLKGIGFMLCPTDFLGRCMIDRGTVGNTGYRYTQDFFFFLR
jgi:hypothetical protein